ncbi:sirohydrochlorin chelatase [Pelomonas aquatica]|jgi:sirohydrochlorin cobaltochelatase|uniref:Cobalamin biosynthesis protein CbiX n=1 Tax=Pelomonas aquatica TaxID=431058 RepID=A0A9X4LLU6_9BURK|nr:CbiX/SirB N-terminal domain-containing protein [Pelomonas aquatica]MCY4757197.1 CbiX/SirB N-terminal domain-containing protein [Pelomonas aquatica]MDG0864917.1 cobalamin biosynthesis protein CbiX [Pelomonas aquatica]
MDGLLLFAHGARDAAWARPFEAVAERLRAARPGTPLALAYLEFMSPGIEEAAARLAAAGCTRVHVLPLFLGTGGHVRRDVPLLLDRLREQHGDAVEWLLHAPLGEQETVLQAISQACLNVLD